MTDQPLKPDDPPGQEVVTGVVAEFSGPEALVAAAARVREAGYQRFDAHSPFPVHGIDQAMGIRPTILPYLVLGAGIAGGVAAIGLQWWTNAFDYPHNISGKPVFSLPANIPVAFEVIVLFSALTAFLGVLVLNLLPQFWHYAFGAPRFARVTSDGFFLTIDAGDPKFDALATRAFLESLGARSIEICRASTTGRSIPKVVWAAVLLAVVAAPLPLLWIAGVRQVPSPLPPVHIVPDMDFQPRYNTQAASALFPDGRAMRPAVAGTIARGRLNADEHLHQGTRGGQWATTFPMKVSPAMGERGRERFGIYCATCHGLTGDRDGMTNNRAQRRGDAAWVLPPALYDQRIIEQPVGQIFHTITHGVARQGAPSMPPYASQIPVEDRWAIVLYVRALQRSQNGRLDDLPQDVQSQLKR